MTQLSELSARKEQLMKQRDAAVETCQTELMQVCKQIDDLLLSQLSSTGLFASRWNAYDDEFGSHIYASARLVLADRSLVDKCVAIVKECPYRYETEITLAEGVKLAIQIGYPGGVWIKFKDVDKIAPFVDFFDLIIDYTYYDNKIAELMKRKKLFFGDKQ